MYQIICEEYNKDAESSGQVHKVPPGLTTSDKRSSTSIRDENDESDSLSIATAHGPDTRYNRHTDLYIADELKAVVK
jgi:hypothetical protein